MVVCLTVVLLLAASPGLSGNRLRMSSTTSTDNSGLFEILLPPFEEQSGIQVSVIAVGTGKALTLGENGDVDVVFVHARAAEDKFVAEGSGVNRRDVMHNDFIVVGPPSDSAQVKAATSAADAMRRIATAKALFISRGDDSGTHKKELSVWAAAGVKPGGGAWYSEAGQGMGAVLQIADEKQAYTLTDRGTHIAYGDKIDLVVLSEGDPMLSNPYGIIAVNPAKHPHVNYRGAMAFIGFVTSPEGQKIIGEFRVNGKQLFYPDAIPDH